MNFMLCDICYLIHTLLSTNKVFYEDQLLHIALFGKILNTYLQLQLMAKFISHTISW